MTKELLTEAEQKELDKFIEHVNSLTAEDMEIVETKHYKIIDGKSVLVEHIKKK